MGCLEGEAMCISGRVTSLLEGLHSPRFGNSITFLSNNRIYLIPEHDNSVPLFTIFVLHSWKLDWLNRPGPERSVRVLLLYITLSLSICPSLKDGYKLFGKELFLHCKTTRGGTGTAQQTPNSGSNMKENTFGLCLCLYIALADIIYTKEHT